MTGLTNSKHYDHSLGMIHDLSMTCQITAAQTAKHVMIVKALNADDRHLRRSIGYKVVQIMRRRERERKAVREKKVGTAIVWKFGLER